MTTTQLEQFTEYTQQYTLELQNIDTMINKGIITYTEYKTLILDAYADFNANIQGMGV